VGFLPLLDNLKIRFWALAIAVIFLLITAFADNVLAPLNRLWAKFGFLLHLIVSPLTLGVIFFLVVMPIGLLMRLFGKDFLHVNIDKSATTYWVERTPVDPESFKNQF
jgi:predicted membrane protein